MKFSEYENEVYDDAVAFIDENIEYYADLDFDECFDQMFLTITGNDNGSYYCNSYRARAAISDCLTDLNFQGHLENYSVFFEELTFDSALTQPETVDVIIRCTVLLSMYSELEDIFNEKLEGLHNDD